MYNNFNTYNQIRSYSKSKRCDHREMSELDFRRVGGDNLELVSSQPHHRTQLEMELQQFEKLSFMVIHLYCH